MAAVLVSTLFLTSHAYLKDSSLQIRACTLTSPFYSRTANGIDAKRTAKTAIQRALREANIDRKDLQLVEIKQNSSQQPPREALSGLGVTQPAEPWSAPATAFLETGWAGLCRLGESMCKLRIRTAASDTPSSISTTRLGHRSACSENPELPSVHDQ